MFEFDESKSELNKTKHGIDFEEAQLLWKDMDRIVIPAKDLDEPRYLMIAKIKEKHWSAIFTIRMKKIRIISVRRSRPNERSIYES
jgi:uncharacterized DUF497 family protein